MLRYREIPFARCISRFPHFPCLEIGEEQQARSSSTASLLFALYSSTFPALTLGEFFSIRVAGRVRVGPILSPGIREQPWGFAQSRVFVSFENALSAQTFDRFFFFFFFKSILDQIVASITS